MTTPSDVAQAHIPFFAVVKLAVNGVRTPGACVGVLKPRVLIDRDYEGKPGFEALCYHECTHAYEYHRLVANTLLGFVALYSALTVTVWLWFAPLVPAAVAAYVWWSRAMETRADAIALYGAGHREFFAFTRKIGPQKTRWGRWCYGGTLAERERRAAALCEKRGWSVTA